MAGGPYYVPRNLKGEGKILFIFSTKGLIYTAIGIALGLGISWMIGMFTKSIIKYIGVVVLGLIGFSIGTFKVPNAGGFEFTRKTGGEKIDDIILRAIKFKKNGNKIYVHTNEEVEKND